MRNLLKLRKNRTFEYEPKYYKGGNPYKFEPKMDQYRTTLNYKRGIHNKISGAVDDLSVKGDPNHTKRFLIILGILVVIVLVFFFVDLPF